MLDSLDSLLQTQITNHTTDLDMYNRIRERERKTSTWPAGRLGPGVVPRARTTGAWRRSWGPCVGAQSASRAWPPAGGPRSFACVWAWPPARGRAASGHRAYGGGSGFARWGHRDRRRGGAGVGRG